MCDSIRARPRRASKIAARAGHERMSAEVEKLLTEGAARLVARAEDARSLDAASVVPRVRRTVEKYLLRDRPDAPAGEVAHFIDTLRADDFLLVIACERGDERAWEDLMGRSEER